MKIFSPEISWHNREPVLSVDIQSIDKDTLRAVTAGYDCHLIVWRILLNSIAHDSRNKIKIEPVADLGHHQKAINVVRFAPVENMFASGDDDGNIFIWKLCEAGNEDESVKKTNADGFETIDIENWNRIKVLHGHVEDVVDLCWSPDGHFLISGSVDNEAIVWDIVKGQKVNYLPGHKGYVQGVAWDPLDNFIATLSTDRILRIFKSQTKRVIHKVHKSNIKVDDKFRTSRLFYDDTLRTYSRRLAFSPGGELLMAPSGIVELEGSDEENFKFINVCYLFLRSAISKPAVYYSTGNKYNTVVRFCPQRFTLREGCENPFPFPYRLVFAIATQDSVVLFDTQQSMPLALVSNIHYTRLSDIAWSDDGRILLVSSTDGYCTFILFDESELGKPYDGEVYKFDLAPAPPVPEAKLITEEIKTPECTKFKKSPDSAKITSFFQKLEKVDSGSKSVKRKEVIDLTTESPIKKKLNSGDEIGQVDEQRQPLFTAFSAKNLDTCFQSIANKQVEDPSKDEMMVDQEVNSENFKETINPLEKMLLKASQSSGANSALITHDEANQVNGSLDKPVMPSKAPRRVPFITLCAPKRD